jgi:hypothetical protein
MSRVGASRLTKYHLVGTSTSWDPGYAAAHVGPTGPVRIACRVGASTGVAGRATEAQTCALSITHRPIERLDAETPPVPLRAVCVLERCT